MARQFMTNAAMLAQIGVCVWVVAFSIRRRGELDRELGAKARALRWTVVLAGWILASLPEPTPHWLAAVAGLAALGFFWWPNLAYHLTRLIEQAHAGGDES
jgi:hypothetical protein